MNYTYRDDLELLVEKARQLIDPPEGYAQIALRSMHCEFAPDGRINFCWLWHAHEAVFRVYVQQQWHAIAGLTLQEITGAWADRLDQIPQYKRPEGLALITEMIHLHWHLKACDIAPPDSEG